ncbi:MAG: D-aminoacyl-tRNA deacylase [Syntrophomonas sp.]
MRAVVQRTNCSQVKVNGVTVGEIGIGLMVLLGIKKGDSIQEAGYLMDKIINLRIFPDDNGKMNRSLVEVGGEVLLVSQFTLYGDVRKGRRPSFTEAGLPEDAQPLFDYCVKYICERGLKVETGEFGADMVLTIENDGPCTILLDTEKQF